MNTRCASHLRTSRQAGFTLVECLVVVAMLLILIAVMLPRVANLLPNARVNGLLQQGGLIYKGFFALQNSVECSLKFPTMDDGYASSTQYFVENVTNGCLNVEFTFFTGPGLPQYRTSNPSRFNPDGNAWSLVLDVRDEISSCPFLISRNLLPSATNVPPKSAALTLAMLGETGKGRKLDFNTTAGVVITKAGTGFIIKKADFTGLPGSMKRLNPTDVSKPLLRP